MGRRLERRLVDRPHKLDADVKANRATIIVVPVFGLLLALGIFAVPPVAAVVLWFWVRRPQRRAALPPFARWSTYTLIGVAGMITVGTLVGLIQSVMAVRAPGLSAPQKQSILASGIAEAMYNGAFAVLLVVIGAIWVGFVRWRVSRRP